jgi:hypothetical protein
LLLLFRKIKMMEADNVKNIVYSKNVIEFVAVAAEYCLLIESVSHHKTQVLIDISRKLLPLLYLKASLLPDITPLLEEDLEKYVTELDYNLWLEKWNAKLGEYDVYYEVFDPDIQFGSETVTASISESLLDIYQDLKDCMTAYSVGNEETMFDALGECINHFRDFWGQRLVNVLRALHQLFIADIPWEEQEEKNLSVENVTRYSKGSDQFFRPKK